MTKFGDQQYAELIRLAGIFLTLAWGPTSPSRYALAGKVRCPEIIPYYSKSDTLGNLSPEHDQRQLLFVSHTSLVSVDVRAIPTTSASSHIRYTLCHKAESCLFIMEMGPLGISVKAIDPILVFNGHDGILEVRINSEAQKWGGRWTCPIREAKWGWSGAGPNVFCVLIGRVKLNVYRRISV